jgi:hypothetical protein
MRLPLIALAAAFGLSLGCSSSTLGTDLGIVQPGCRAPSACFLVDCACNRGDVTATDMGAPACRACDPNAQFCICENDVDLGAAQVCIEAATLCVGKSTLVCSGTGARCLPKGSTCATSGGDPPQLIANGMNLEPHCQYADDTCCPGAADLGVSD